MVREIKMETKRLLIRNFSEDDADACYQSWGQDRALGQYIAPYPVSDIRQMADLVRGLASNRNAWVIVDKRLEKIVGYITVDVPYEQLGVGEIGYVIGERYQRQGYAMEAIHCILTEYLINKKLYLIEAKCNESNHASLKLIERSGFRAEGRLRGRRVNLLTGQRNDLLVFSITRDEFMKI